MQTVERKFNKLSDFTTETESMQKALIESMKKGDTRCSFPLGSTVIKTKGEKGDAHKAFSEGVIVGSLYMTDHPVKDLKEAYLVMFTGETEPYFTIGSKLSLK